MSNTQLTFLNISPLSCQCFTCYLLAHTTSTTIKAMGGCNHFTCSCRHQFCWLCLRDWKTHGNHTGGLYDCNVFASNVSRSESRRRLSLNGDKKCQSMNRRALEMLLIFSSLCVSPKSRCFLASYTFTSTTSSCLYSQARQTVT